MEDFVDAGGTLFLNAARNELTNNVLVDMGFGVTIDAYQLSNTASFVGAAGHPIVTGPNGNAGTNWSGGYFSHDAISGPGLTQLIVGARGTILAETDFGSGHALFGGMTTNNFQSPDPQTDALRANILDYAASFATDYLVV